METLALEKFIKSLGPELYSFAYVLIPDDLQASQLMIDAVQAFMIQKKSLIDKWGNSNAKNACQEDVKRHLYHLVSELSKKRFNQLKMSFQERDDISGFSSMDFDEKAALYLRERTHISLEDMEFILGKGRAELLAFLQSARMKMIRKLPSSSLLGKLETQNHLRNHN